MLLYSALPPELYEIINCAIASTAFVAWAICIRYLTTQWLQIRELHRQAHGTPAVRYSIAAILRDVLRLRLAIALTIFLTGEWTRMGWLWLARYQANTNVAPDWMGGYPWVLVPIVTSLITCLGLACVVRAIAPEAWGRWGYVIAIGAAAATVVASQLFR